MYAVIKTGGKQYRVTEGQELHVELLGVDEGEVDLTPVLLVDGDTEELAKSPRNRKARSPSSLVESCSRMTGLVALTTFCCEAP